MLGGEFFRAHLTYHRRYTFEDAVILVYDMERALEQLAYFGQQLIAWAELLLKQLELTDECNVQRATPNNRAIQKGWS